MDDKIAPLSAVAVDPLVIRPFLDLVELIQRSATRLHRLGELNAPKMVIENERRVLLSRVLEIPVDTESQLRAQNQERSLREEEEKFLAEHGFYDEPDDGCGLYV